MSPDDGSVTETGALFSPEALSAQLDKVKNLPQGEGRIGVVAKEGDVGVSGAVNVDIGKPGGFFVAGEGAWWRRAGYSVAGMLGWKKDNQ